jgi:hypothetical protein
LIMTHYEDAVELTSPVAAHLLGTSGGKVVGKTALRAYFQQGLEVYSELRFHLEDVLWGVNSVVLCYTSGLQCVSLELEVSPGAYVCGERHALFGESRAPADGSLVLRLPCSLSSVLIGLFNFTFLMAVSEASFAQSAVRHFPDRERRSPHCSDLALSGLPGRG